MSGFKKGLFVGIVIMSSIFLFIGSTSPKMGSNDRREIVKYKTVNIDMGDRGINLSIKEGWQPFSSPFLDHKSSTIQAMVKYKED